MHYSYVYCSVASNVIGVGQDQIFAYWTADMPPDTGETDAVLSGAFGRAMWSGVSFNLTTPSGVTTNIPVPSGPTRLDWRWIFRIFTHLKLAHTMLRLFSLNNGKTAL